MNRQMRNIVISACVVAILAGSVVLLNVLPGKKSGSSSSSSTDTLSSSSSSNISLLSIKSDQFRSMHVSNTSGGYVITYTGGTYNVDALKEAPSNQSAIKSKVSDVLNLKAMSLIKKNATDLMPYGLSSPTATIAINTSDNKTETVKIGSKSPTGSGVYVLKPGTNDIYLSSTMMNDDFTQSAIQYASTTISSLSQSANLSAYKFGGTARSTAFTVAVTESASSVSSSSSSASYSYALSQPFVYDVNSTNADKITTALQSLSATNVVSVDTSADSLAKYGLQDPAYTLTYTVNGKDTTLFFGNVDSSNSTVYMTVSEKKAIYQVDTSSAAAFYNYQLSDLLSTALFTNDVDTVKTLTVQSGSESHTFDVSKASNNKLSVKSEGKSINATSFQNYYEDLLALTTSGSADKPAGVSPSLTVTITYNDNTPQRVVSFLPDGSGKSFVEINGAGALSIDNSKISSLMTLAQNLEAGKTVSATS